MRTRLIPFGVAASLVLGLTAGAAPPKGDEIPPALRAWTGWVMHGDDSAGCPFLQGGEERRCVWPGQLALVLEPRGGRFVQRAHAFREGWLVIPGSPERWPQSVQVDGRAAVVVPRGGGEERAGGRPAVRLSEGEHEVTGSFAWTALPEAIEVPPDTGLVGLTVGGRSVAMPQRDEEGRVYLQREGGSADEAEEELDVTVHRLVTDDTPLTLTTRLTLAVSGKSREVLLGRVLPPAFLPMALESRLPARLEPDGRLRLQVRPGTWTLTLVARGEGPVAELRRPAPDGPWTERDEVWTFEAKPSLRQVRIEGAEAVDPSQTTLPAEWRRFPAYAIGEKDTLRLVESRRGDADPPPDRLELIRTLWLDFDGRGLTAADRVTGQLHRSWRLEVQPGTELGRVVAAGADQPITRLGPGRPPGVELRQGGLALESESRLPREPSGFSAVSWDADFQSVRTTLKLPPGWSLLHASGADRVPGTWLASWTLFDLFVVLLTAVVVGRLFAPGFGLLALAALVLAWHEADAPHFVWLAALGGEALIRVLPAGRVQQLVRFYRWAAWAVLVVLVLQFSLRNVREGVFPALAQTWRELGDVKSWAEYSSENHAQYERSVFRSTSEVSAGYGGDQGMQESLEPEAQGWSPPMILKAEKADGLGGNEAPEAQASVAIAQLKAPPSPPKGALQKQAASTPADRELGSPEAGGPGKAKAQSDAARSRQRRSQNVLDYDRKAVVQTGPGLPRWEWIDVPVHFSGPVARSQRLSLWLAGPSERAVACFVRVALLWLLAACVLGFPGRFWPQSWRWRRGSGGVAGSAALVALLAALGAARPARADPLPSGDFPNDELLTELGERLKEAPECAPACASSPRLLVEASPTRLRLRLEVLAAAATAIPLPGNAQHWLPDSVVVDGKPGAALASAPEGALWLAVSEGAHQVLLEGPLPARETVQVELPLRSYRVEAKLDGWRLDGLHEDGVADESLQLTREAAAGERAAAALQGSTMPPFVRVERELVLDLQWTLRTRVERLTPAGAAVVLDVPLLAGESVTSSELRVQGGRVLVNMPAQASEVSWTSVLETRPSLTLEAPKTTAWIEVWRLDASPVWHVELAGIPMVHQQESQEAKRPEWRPWPGEKVVLTVTRPEGVPGQTVTLDQSSLELRPGARATDARFTANLRSSRGGVHRFELPAGAELGSVTVNGQEQPIRQEGAKVAIPLVPGSVGVAMSWRQDEGLATLWRSPVIGLGTASVNAALSVRLPEDRWVLFATGPRLGPAVLFWSFLLVLLGISAGLSRLGLGVPLATRHWMGLAVGLSQMPVPVIALVFGWLLLLGWRERSTELGPAAFDLRQLVIVGVTFCALVALGAAVYDGLMGRPEMQVRGNGSTASHLRWFVDRTDGASPSAWVLSAPMFVYRSAMLAWSLWMAFALVRWLKWGWTAFSAGGLWHRGARSPAKDEPRR